MSQTIRCHGCGSSFAAAPHLYGRTIPCPACGTPLTVPPQGAFGPVSQPNALPQQSAFPPSNAFPAPVSIPAFGPAVGGSSSNSPHAGKSGGSRTLLIVLGVLGSLLLLCAGCAGFFVWRVSEAINPPAQTQYADLLEGRRGFVTQLVRREKSNDPAVSPPANVLVLEKYRSPAGELAAYVSPSPGDGKRRPAIVWIFGGFDNGIGDTAWEPQSPDNDQSARAFREAGIVMMYPSFRGGNDNPGFKEGLYGEVDDLLAAVDHLARKDYVDPQRIYLGGHSTGGTMAMLAAAASPRFRAVFALGPVDDVLGYGPEALPFNVWDSRERSLRNPGQWLHAMRSPLFVIEGEDGNVSCLETMRDESKNPAHRFCVVRGQDHFSIIAPVTKLLAEKVLQDSGPSCTIQLTEPELQSRF